MKTYYGQLYFDKIGEDEFIDGKISNYFTEPERFEITIYSDSTSVPSVLVNGEYLRLRRLTEHCWVCSFLVDTGDQLDIDLGEGVTGSASVIHLPVTHPTERGGGEKLCEIIEDTDLSLFDRLRSEMLSALSRMREDQYGGESFEEATDLEDDFDDDMILTPYEYEEMQDEVPVENPSYQTHDDGDSQPDADASQQTTQKISKEKDSPTVDPVSS